MSSHSKTSKITGDSRDSRYSSSDNLLDDESLPPVEVQRVTCYKCNKIYDNPILLPCLHAVCGRCHSTLMKENKPVCPECKEDIKNMMKSNTFASRDHVMQKAVSDIQFHRKVTGRQDAPCERCTLGKSASAFCTVCTKFLCEHCSKDHTISLETRDHSIEKMNELKNKATKAGKSGSQVSAKMPVNPKPKQSVPATSQVDSSMCSLHPGKELEFYCSNCQFLGCYKCIMTDHIKKGHEYIQVDDEFVKKERKMIETELAPVNDLIKRYQEAGSTFDQRIVQLGTHATNVRQAIQNSADILHKAVDARKDTLMTQLDGIEKAKKQKMTEQSERVKSHGQKLVAARDIVMYALQNGTIYDILQMKKQALERLQQLKATHDNSDSLTPEESIWLKFSEPDAREVDTLQDVLADFGHISDGAHAPNCIIQFPTKLKEGEKLKIQLTALDKFDRPCNNEQAAIVATLRPKEGKLYRGKVTETSNGVYLIAFDGKLVSEAHLSVTVAKEHAKGSPSQLALGPDGTLAVKEGVPTIKMNGENGGKKSVRFTEDTKPPSPARPPASPQPAGSTKKQKLEQ